MGTRKLEGYTTSFYTPEQQARLGVDEQGNKKTATSKPTFCGITTTPVTTSLTAQQAPAPVQAAKPMMCGAIGPAWTRGEIEKPAGEKNMGSWTAAVYTPEQQARL